MLVSAHSYNGYVNIVCRKFKFSTSLMLGRKCVACLTDQRSRNFSQRTKLLLHQHYVVMPFMGRSSLITVKIPYFNMYGIFANVALYSSYYSPSTLQEKSPLISSSRKWTRRALRTDGIVNGRKIDKKIPYLY